MSTPEPHPQQPHPPPVMLSSLSGSLLPSHSSHPAPTIPTTSTVISSSTSRNPGLAGVVAHYPTLTSSTHNHLTNSTHSTSSTSPSLFTKREQQKPKKLAMLRDSPLTKPKANRREKGPAGGGGGGKGNGDTLGPPMKPLEPIPTAASKHSMEVN